MQIKDYLNQLISNKLEQFLLNYITYGSILFFPHSNSIIFSYENLKSKCDNSSGDNGYEIFSYYVQVTKINKNDFIEVKFYFENYLLISDSLNLDGNDITIEKFLAIVLLPQDKNHIEIYLHKDFEDEGVFFINNVMIRFLCKGNNIFISQIEGIFQIQNLERLEVRKNIVKKQMKLINHFPKLLS